MNWRESKGEVLRKNWSIFVLLLVIALGLKQHFSVATVDDLTWILSPTSKVVTLFTGLEFNQEAGVGYVSSDNFVSIIKPCAGVNFFIILFLLFTFPVVGHIISRKKQILFTLGILITTYLLTIGVNAVRITTAILLFKQDFYTELITVELVHKIDGIVVYFGALLLLFPLYLKVVAMCLKRESDFSHLKQLPLLIYLVVTLCIPFVRMFLGTATFIPLSHVAMVLGIPLILLLIVNFFSRKKVHSS